VAMRGGGQEGGSYQPFSATNVVDEGVGGLMDAKRGKQLFRELFGPWKGVEAYRAVRRAVLDHCEVEVSLDIFTSAPAIYARALYLKETGQEKHLARLVNIYNLCTYCYCGSMEDTSIDGYERCTECQGC